MRASRRAWRGSIVLQDRVASHPQDVNGQRQHRPNRRPCASQRIFLRSPSRRDGRVSATRWHASTQGRRFGDAIDGAHDQRIFEGNRVSTGTPGHRPKGMSRPLLWRLPVRAQQSDYAGGPPTRTRRPRRRAPTTCLLYANRSVGSNSVHDFCAELRDLLSPFPPRPILARPGIAAVARPRC